MNLTFNLFSPAWNKNYLIFTWTWRKFQELFATSEKSSFATAFWKGGSSTHLVLAIADDDDDDDDDDDNDDDLTVEWRGGGLKNV